MHTGKKAMSLSMRLVDDEHDRCGASGKASEQFSLVQNLVILASHTMGCRMSSTLDGCSVDINDILQYQLFSRELRHQQTTSLWTMFFHREYDKFSRVQIVGSPKDPCCVGCTENMLVYGEQAVWQLYPRLGDTMKTHPEKRVVHDPKNSYLGYYYWFHAALPLWNTRYGRCFPKLKYIWRMEMDVLWTGTFDTLISLASEDTRSDVLLPFTWTENKTFATRGYFFFRAQPFLDSMPADIHVYSYVAVGRYSTKFLFNTMHSLWSAGVAGYEEILIPSACLNTSGCLLGNLNGWTSAASSKRSQLTPLTSSAFNGVPLVYSSPPSFA